MTGNPTLPLDWPSLCAHVRRGWLPPHRGEMPAARPDRPATDAPVAIAACARFSRRHAFATEAEAETWRWVGPRALNVCTRWAALRHDREALRVALDAVRHWRAQGNVRQAALARDELRRLWARYRHGMRATADQLDRVRHALTPRQPPRALWQQAAE
jgi:hypothetical protein